MCSSYKNDLSENLQGKFEHSQSPLQRTENKYKIIFDLFPTLQQGNIRSLGTCGKWRFLSPSPHLLNQK